MKLSYIACAWMAGSVLGGIENNRRTSSSYIRSRYLPYLNQQDEGILLQEVPTNLIQTDGNTETSNSNPWSRLNNPHKQLITLKTNADKVKALRWKLLGLISEEAKQLSSNNQSIVSIAFLAFGVILFDVLTDAIFGDQSSLVASLIGSQIQARETMLPGLGLFGDNINNLAEVVLNMLTIYLYRDESPDCGQRLLCESNQQAVSRGFLDSLVTYISGFSVSFFLRQAPISDNLEAMRAGRKGLNCIEIYPRCSISL